MKKKLNQFKNNKEKISLHEGTKLKMNAETTNLELARETNIEMTEKMHVQLVQDTNVRIAEDALEQMDGEMHAEMTSTSNTQDEMEQSRLLKSSKSYDPSAFVAGSVIFLFFFTVIVFTHGSNLPYTLNASGTEFVANIRFHQKNPQHGPVTR